MRIYADNAATTRMSQTAIQAMLPYFDRVYGNPSSLHSAGQEAMEALTSARERVAKVLGATAREIYFTSGGSEADNQAIRTAAILGKRKGKTHIISTAFEHHAVLHTLKKLEKEWLRQINETGIGPQGLGGRTTCLGLHIHQEATHIACLPVAVNVGCHVTRHATAVL